MTSLVSYLYIDETESCLGSYQSIIVMITARKTIIPYMNNDIVSEGNVLIILSYLICWSNHDYDYFRKIIHN